MPETIEKLNETNYPEWSYIMKALLIKKDLWDIVSGIETRPPGNTKAVRSFIKKQSVACSEIILNIEKSQLAHTHYEDPKQIWDKLGEIHRPTGFSTRLAIWERFFYSKMEEKSVNAWVSEIKTIVLHLNEAGVQVDEDWIILAICAGLPPSYSAFRISLDNIPAEEFSLDNVIKRLLNDEKRQKAAISKNEDHLTDLALVAKFKKKTTRPIEDVVCYNCGGRGHYQSDCPSAKRRESSALAATPEADDDAFEHAF